MRGLSHVTIFPMYPFSPKLPYLLDIIILFNVYSWLVYKLSSNHQLALSSRMSFQQRRGRG